MKKENGVVYYLVSNTELKGQNILVSAIPSEDPMVLHQIQREDEVVVSEGVLAQLGKYAYVES